MTSRLSTPTPTRPTLRLLLLVALVVLVHWAVLRAMPHALAAQAAPLGVDRSGAFAMRTLAAEPASKAVLDPAPPSLPRSRAMAPPVLAHATAFAANGATGQPTDPAITPDTDSNQAIAPVPLDFLASENIANANPAVAHGAPVLLATATPPATTSSSAPSFAASKTAELPAETASGALNPAAPAPASKSLAPAKAVRDYVFPPAARLKYDVRGEIKGFPYMVNGELQWKPEDKTYTARLEVSHFLLGSRVQTSTGQLGPLGLEPMRFGDKVRSEVAAHFERHKNKVTFSANTPDAPLLAGAQDQLSVFIQLASMLAADPKAFAKGSTLNFQAVGPRSSENWIFNVGTLEKISLPAGEFSGIRLWRDPSGEYDTKLEIWLSPELGYLPARMRLTQANGDFVDQQLRSTGK